MEWSYAKIWKKILFSPFFLALPVAVVAILFLPDLFPKYKSELVETGFIDKRGGYEFWEDINQDGVCERIIFFHNTEGAASIKIIEKKGYIGDHYYCRGRMLSDDPSFVFGHFDNSNNNLIFVFSLIHDSVFLNCIDHANLRDFLFRDLFVDKVQMPGRTDVHAGVPFFEDLDGDGWNEIIFAIHAGFPLQPRGCYIYDFRKNKLIRSPEMGVFLDVTAIEDINHDGFKEVFMKTYSIFNYPDSLAGLQDDRSAWIMAFNKDLSFLFSPVEFRGKYIHIKTLPIKTEKDWKLISLLYQSVQGKYSPRLILSTVQGELISERNLVDTLERSEMDIFYIDQERECIYLTDQHGHIEKIDSTLQSIEKFIVPGLISGDILTADLDEDGKKEIVHSDSYNYTPVIVRHNLSSPLYLDLPPSNESRFTQIRTLENGRNTIAIQQAGHFYHYSYDRNRFYFLKFPFYIGIYLFILGFIYLIRRLQGIQIEHRKKLGDEITTLQLKSIKSQFDPHLTFNIMTSISYAVHQENKELTNQFIDKFSAFIRGIVADSDKISRTIGRELLLISNYLDVEKMRLQHFEYVITTPEGFNLSVEIPKNIVLTFVENAIKHGIRPKEGSAKIIVRAEEKTDGLMEICVEDDGVGRSAQEDASTEYTGKGFLIVGQILDLWDKLYGKRITLTIEDLTDNGKTTGTRVRISIPL